MPLEYILNRQVYYIYFFIKLQPSDMKFNFLLFTLNINWKFSFNRRQSRLQHLTFKIVPKSL